MYVYTCIYMVYIYIPDMIIYIYIYIILYLYIYIYYILYLYIYMSPVPGPPPPFAFARYLQHLGSTPPNCMLFTAFGRDTMALLIGCLICTNVVTNSCRCPFFERCDHRSKANNMPWGCIHYNLYAIGLLQRPWNWHH